MRPLWALDIDGVVAPVGENHCGDPHLHASTPASLGHAAEMWLCWDASIVTRVAELHRSSVVEVAWLTTWLNDAATHFAPAVGLPDFAAIPEVSSTQAWSKLAWLVEYQKRHPVRPLVWTDDHLSPARRRAARRHLPGPLLLMQPVSAVGLTHRHLDRIERFAAEVNG